eukprot:338638_1
MTSHNSSLERFQRGDINDINDDDKEIDKQERLDINQLSEEELYFNIHIWAVRKLLITKYKHNAKFWSNAFKHYTNIVKNNPSQRHQHWIYFKRLRKLIYHQTSDILKNQYYILNNKRIFLNQNKAFQKSIKGAVLYDDTRKLNRFHGNMIKQVITNNTIIKVLNIDCIDGGQQLVENGYNPIILNCGGSRHAGGGWTDGAGAQEENLFRRTSFSVVLNKKTNCNLYPIPKYGCIYVPNIVVFRGNEINGYELLGKPFEMAFIIGCMIRHPKYNNKNVQKINNIICDKIRSIFRVSLYYKHDSIVLTAWGCGDFGNKPKDIAGLFKQVIDEKEFRNRFKTIVFAILDDHNSNRSHNRDGNIIPFIKVFG